MDKLVELEDHIGVPAYVRPSAVKYIAPSYKPGCTAVGISPESGHVLTVKGSPREVHAKLFPEPA